jgi:CRP/FNR family transcriptional regulator
VRESEGDCIPRSYPTSWGRSPLTPPGAGGPRLGSNIQIDLATGRSNLMSKLHSSPPLVFNSGAQLTMAGGPCNAIYHIRAGWACQFHDLANGHRAIVDIFLPGDVIGLDTALQIRPLKDVLILTSVTSGVIPGRDALVELMACPQTALYIAWLLAQRQRRTDRLLTAVLSLDARGRLATMLLNFYKRLKRRRLITGSTYSLPLTQIQIGSYLGLTVVHVNRVLRSLREEQIAQVEKHCVTIVDLDRLQSLAVHGAVVPAKTDERQPTATALQGCEAAD